MPAHHFHRAYGKSQFFNSAAGSWGDYAPVASLSGGTSSAAWLEERTGEGEVAAAR